MGRAVSHKCVLAFRTVKWASGCRTGIRTSGRLEILWRGFPFVWNTTEATSNALCFISLSPDFLFSFSSRDCANDSSTTVFTIWMLFVGFYYISFVYLRPVWLSTAPACLFIQNGKMKTLLTLRKLLLHWSSLRFVCWLVFFLFWGVCKSYFTLWHQTTVQIINILGHENNCLIRTDFWKKNIFWFVHILFFISFNFCLGSLASSTCRFVNVNTVNRF